MARVRFVGGREQTGVVNSRLPPGLSDLAARQFGVVSRDQASDYGLTRSAIAAHLQTGRWQRMHRGVYATFSGEPGRLAVLWSAVLSAGAGALLSHQTAAELAGLTDKTAELVHVTVPSERRVSRTPGLVIHYSARAREAAHPARLPPQTRIEETVLDLADAERTIDDACAWIFRALQRRRTTQKQLARALTNRAKIRWRSQLTELLTLDADGLHSLLELRYHRRVERPHGLPRGTRQFAYRRGEHNEYRDVLYEAYLTAVELDGAATHRRDTRWQDVQRDNAAAEDGITTLRYGWLDVTASPCAVAAQVARVLARRGYTGARPCSPGCPVGLSRPAPPRGQARFARQASPLRPDKPASHLQTGPGRGQARSGKSGTGADLTGATRSVSPGA